MNKVNTRTHTHTYAISRSNRKNITNTNTQPNNRNMKKLNANCIDNDGDYGVYCVDVYSGVYFSVSTVTRTK